MKKIYLAGGCFWGMQGYFKRVLGVVNTTVGYANGNTSNTNYRALKETDHVETLEIEYNQNLVRLEELLLRFFKLIDPLSLNKQGGDIGRQYRTGIYYVDENDVNIINKVYDFIENKIGEKLVVENEKLKEYILAEDYHQDYLDKNPDGYCHINLSSVYEPLFDKEYTKPEIEVLRSKLSNLEFEISQNSATERPFSSEFEDHYEEGIYINVVTGEPLFLSYDKFDAGCGWPSFTRPILTETVNFYEDNSHGMNRIEVKSAKDLAHLGHVFTDGPKAKGSLRYCINGSILRFVPKDKLEEYGYKEYIVLF
ncbi:peptide-methionine (R)-S-oxide reductase MsrB [Streptobacillus felis]|uniref:Peptide methionine sulfoxide reductase MsrA n=1 Tax=Streptobacillus felis TaxID=1384509 RepID=A0A7Z0PFM3_9FUSO|nr:peptide-methionine (R)-S-oxide reductase MsrB [Streptobacillus felis]NYV28374.1 peptide-methionine (R)-S-oxide reductase MsrB [Streptobacillus felis]